MDNVMRKGEISEADAGRESASRAVQSRGMNIGQIAISVGLKHGAAVAGYYIELVVMKRVESAPVGRNVPIGAARRFGFVKRIGEGAGEIGKWRWRCREHRAVLQVMLEIQKPEQLVLQNRP